MVIFVNVQTVMGNVRGGFLEEHDDTHTESVLFVGVDAGNKLYPFILPPSGDSITLHPYILESPIDIAQSFHKFLLESDPEGSLAGILAILIQKLLKEEQNGQLDKLVGVAYIACERLDRMIKDNWVARMYMQLQPNHRNMSKHICSVKTTNSFKSRIKRLLADLAAVDPSITSDASYKSLQRLSQ